MGAGRVGEAVGPLAQERLDQRLGFPVRPGRVGAGVAALDAELETGVACQRGSGRPWRCRRARARPRSPARDTRRRRGGGSARRRASSGRAARSRRAGSGRRSRRAGAASARRGCGTTGRRGRVCRPPRSDRASSCPRAGARPALTLVAARRGRGRGRGRREQPAGAAPCRRSRQGRRGPRRSRRARRADARASQDLLLGSAGSRRGCRIGVEGRSASAAQPPSR